MFIFRNYVAVGLYLSTQDVFYVRISGIALGNLRLGCVSIVYFEELRDNTHK